MFEIEIPLEQCLLHAQHMRNLSSTYIRGIKRSVQSFVKHGNIRTIEQLTQNKLENWLLDGRAFRKWWPATYRARLRDVSFFIKYLVKREKISEDISREIELPKLSQSIPRWISTEDAERLIATTRRMRYSYRFEEKRNVALITTMVFTGLRKNEILSLKRSDVDLKTMTIHVVYGKWRKERIVPISTRLATYLKDYIADRERLKKECEFFFTSAQHDSQMPIKAVNSMIDRLRERTGIRFTAHGLRHTFATLMLEWWCDLYTLSRIMGHSKITTTTIYLSCSTKLMISSIEKHPLN